MNKILIKRLITARYTNSFYCKKCGFEMNGPLGASLECPICYAKMEACGG